MMNPARKRRLLSLIFIISVVMLVSGLILYAMRQNINLFYTPTQVVEGEAPLHHNLRLGGMVVKDSIVRGKKGLLVKFKLTDFKQTLSVQYEGILPDLFREGQGIVALGVLRDNKHFIAQEILAKHDANYMPPEVKDALAKAAQPGVNKSA